MDYKKLKKEELKKILDKKNIKYSNKAKKEELIKLIEEAEKTKETKKKVVKRKVKTEKQVSKTKKKISETQLKETSVEIIEKEIPQETYIKDEIEKFHSLPDFKFLKKINYDIPPSYNTNKLVLLVVDPYWIYSFWEINSDVRNQLSNQYGNDIIRNDNVHLYLYDITGIQFDGNNGNKIMEIRVGNYKGNWFINVNRPDTYFIAKLGFRDRNGNLIEVLRSNIIKAPRDRESENLEQIWAYIDIDKPISLEMRKMLKKYLEYEFKADFTSSFGSIFGSHSILKKK